MSSHDAAASCIHDAAAAACMMQQLLHHVLQCSCCIVLQLLAAHDAACSSSMMQLLLQLHHSCMHLKCINSFPISNDDSLSFLLDPAAEIPMLELYVDAEQIHVEPPPPMSQQWGDIPQMSNQWGEYMNLLATPGLPPCSNTDYLAGTSNPDFGAGTSNLDFGADEASEPDEAEYPIPPEDGPDRVDINVMAETFAQRGAETSSEPTLPDLNTQPTFYRSIQFFQQTFPEIPADSVDVPNLRYAKFYNKSEGRLDKGMLFKTKEELMEAVQDHSIRHARREYYKLRVQELSGKCSASTVQKSSGVDGRAYIASLHLTREMQPSYGIKHVIQNVKDQTGYDVPYQKAWYSLKMAREIVYGTWESSVQKLPAYLGAIQNIIQELLLNGNTRLTGVNCVDGTHLYTKYKYKLLIAAAMDGNQQDLCWQAGSEYQLRKFNRIMDEIKKQDVKAFAYLDAINKEKWAASHDGGWRCGILTTNMSECINGVLKGARRLPVSALVEITLERTVHYFHVRAMKGQKMLQNNQLWTDFACKMFISWQQKAVEHTVTKYSHAQQSASVVTRRQGRHGMNTHVVKIANRECSCGKWNQFGIPCSHAQKVCGAYNISAASMVKDYYDVMAYNNTYSKHFEPVQSEDYWDDPNFQLVHDPTIRTVTRPGRNQTTRIHNEMDWRQTRARQEAQQQQGDSSIQENVP
ncbi:hypothetical protein Sango_1282800 [Sesamum angolense]|uniref:SWIM-type domain-containing protein n=1 Tax=Sesamum angolense TaxID=2727404 RepID=A0AAE2BUI1_9LAMI|nr:hypothetical protein Sango_1282800 [Sesamum angolense]